MPNSLTAFALLLTAIKFLEISLFFMLDSSCVYTRGPEENPESGATHGIS